jgi:NAD-dependent SIR2 family protein deacetylase
MTFQDKTIQCSDCGTTFAFSAEEQEFSQSKGFTNEPKRCPSCHAATKTKRYGDGDYSYRSRSWQQMFRLNSYQVLDAPNSN